MRRNLIRCFNLLEGFTRIFDLHYFYSKDVRLPVQLQRAMAAEAEAAREARAKVIIYVP